MTILEEIFLLEQNPVSKRWALFDENDNIAYLYLTERESQQPLADVVVYAKELVHHHALTAPLRQGLPPMLTQDYASPVAIRTDIKREDISFLWSAKGNAVAACIRGEPVAFVTASGGHAFSRAVGREGPFGKPWNHAGFEKLFTPATEGAQKEG